MNALVSVGTNIKRPGKLQTEPIVDIITGICAGRWGEPVGAVRALPYRSREQQEAKEGLAYWTPAGMFSHRSAAALIRHSGHLAIDLDNLGVEGATGAIQTAVADPFCKYAFRSATDRGVRLIFNCPECTPVVHKVMFESAALHVRKRYGLQPDTSGSDISRACFVSFDRGLWLNPSAGMLPGLAALAKVNASTIHNDPMCVVESGGVVSGLSEGDLNTLAYGLGESRACCPVRQDGTAETHFALLLLGLDLVVRYRRHRLVLTHSEIDRAFEAWMRSCKRQGLRFRKSCESYRHELEIAVLGAERKPWLGRVVDFWQRWTRASGFPTTGSSDERLVWAIRAHCAEFGTFNFFISARDAAIVTDTTYGAANNTLHRLVSAGFIQRVGKRLHARHAQEYVLL